MSRKNEPAPAGGEPGALKIRIRGEAAEEPKADPLPAPEDKPEKKSEALKRKRAEAAKEGKRIPEDRRRNLTLFGILCVILAAWLWYIMLFSREYFADQPVSDTTWDRILSEARAVGFSALVSLPLGLLMGLSRVFYRKDTFLGLRFHGSRFLRRYIPTALICYAGFFLLWTGVAYLLHVDREKSMMVYTTGISIYLLVGLVAWRGNYYALPELTAKK